MTAVPLLHIPHERREEELRCALERAGAEQRVRLLAFMRRYPLAVQASVSALTAPQAALCSSTWSRE